MMSLQKIALGGGCHWCTEAIFLSLIGVEKVEQGYVSSTDENSSFSEAVILHFNKEKIPLEILIEIHLLTYKSTSNHSMRTKYRSAIYTFDEAQEKKIQEQLEVLQSKFQNKIITQVLPFVSFKPSREQIQNYYFKNPNKPFCESFINPKLQMLLSEFKTYSDLNKLKHLDQNEAYET
ncbi:peptide-methionine (S)-S-oxide reductase [Seonamhaeicola marinus]|uniref:peptide-methionine (S)-S-oxide reductase n=1 Tax=Seonamhaeicola marinus TaxID=1912246 RepID=A0A5D0HKT3_9FLAO|nr:peptide-methionine (S)-S-oxide reductase [Seonamhaeicola marinus]TYA69912.1 peptide methionine sulfoxide reductase [Seonamhaeicola marinus]